MSTYSYKGVRAGVPGLSAWTPSPWWNFALTVQPGNLIVARPFYERSGSVAYDISGNERHGTYSNVTLGARVGPTGDPAPLWNDPNPWVLDPYMDGFSASLASVWIGGEFTILMFIKPALWVEARTRLLFYYGSDTNNYVYTAINVSGGLTAEYKAGATSRFKNSSTPLAYADWVMAGVRVSKSAGASGEFDLILDGIADGSPATTLGTWAGALTTALVGDHPTSNYNMNGGLAGELAWNTALTDEEIASLASPPNFP